MQFTLGHLLLTVSFYALKLKSTCIKLPTTQLSCPCIFFVLFFGISLSHTWYKYFTYRYIPVIGHQHQYSHVPRFISDLYMEVQLTYLSVYAFGTWSTNVHNNTHVIHFLNSFGQFKICFGKLEFFKWLGLTTGFLQ